MKRTRGVLLAVFFLTTACGARLPRATPTGNAAATGNTEVLTGDQAPAAGPDATSSAGGVTELTPGAQPGAAAKAGGGGGNGASPAANDIGPAPGVTATEIKIGYLLSLSGAAPVPSDFSKGANVYWNYINAKGGIFGRKITPVIKDTQSNGQVGKDQAKALIEQDKVFAIVVLDRLENQQQIGEYLDSRHFPNIEIQTPANLSKTQTWTFGVTIDHGVQGSLIADYFVRVLHASKGAVVYENTPDLKPGVDAFKAEMNKLGAQVTYSEAIKPNENDFSQQALALARSGATATWLYMAPTPAAKLANQADSAGYHPTWFANSISWNFDLIFPVAPKALQGARAFSPWLPLSDPRTNTYQQAYQQQNGTPADDLGIVGWGVGEIVGKGLELAGKNLGQNAFRNAVQTMKYAPDVWAPLNFGPGVREGANVVAVLKQDGAHWSLDHDFTSSF